MRYLLLLLCALFLALGCGDSRRLGTVSGKVTLDGQPLPNARVNFQPMEGRNPGIGSYGQTDVKGEYSLTLIDEKAQGAMVGLHRVIIKAAPAKGSQTDDKVPAGKDVVPPEYNTNSILQFEVKPGHNEANFDLKKKK